MSEQREYRPIKENGQVDLVELSEWYKMYMNTEIPEWVVQQTHQLMFEDGYKGEIDVWTLTHPPERVALATQQRRTQRLGGN